MSTFNDIARLISSGYSVAEALRKVNNLAFTFASDINMSAGICTLQRATDGTVLSVVNSLASFTGIAITVDISRAATSAFELFNLRSNNISQFSVNGQGDMTIAGDILNTTGNLTLKAHTNSALLTLQSFNSSGSTKLGVVIGGAVPNVDFYGDGVLSFSTKASSTYRTINFASIPTSATGLSVGDVWSNAGVLTIV